MPPKSKKDGVGGGNDAAAALAAKMSLDKDLEGGEGKTVDDVVPFHQVKPKKEVSRAEKEKMFIVKKIETRLVNLLPEAKYDIVKTLCGIVGFLFTVAGTVIVLKSLSLTVLFASDAPDATLFAVGCSFIAPCMIWFVYIFIWPHLPCSHCRNIKASRRFIHDQRRERKDPSLFNNMVAAANKFSEPPIVRTRLFAMFRKKEYTIVCHTMQEFQEIFHFKTGVEPARQLLKLREPDDSSYEFVFKPEEFILDLERRGVVKDTLFWVYTRGGLEVDLLRSPEHRMKIVRRADPILMDVLEESVQKFNRGAKGKDVLESELDNMIDAEAEADRRREEAAELQAAEHAAEARRLREEADYIAREDAPDTRSFLQRMSPFAKPKKTRSQLAAEDPHDEEYRRELALHKERLFRKLNPEPEPEEEGEGEGGGS